VPLLFPRVFRVIRVPRPAPARTGQTAALPFLLALVFFAPDRGWPQKWPRDAPGKSALCCFLLDYPFPNGSESTHPLLFLCGPGVLGTRFFKPCLVEMLPFFSFPFFETRPVSTPMAPRLAEGNLTARPILLIGLLPNIFRAPLATLFLVPSYGRLHFSHFDSPAIHFCGPD